MPLSDSSQTYMRAVWPKPSPAVLRLTFAAGVCEVSRFSCMKFLGVPGVFDYARLSGNSRYRSHSCCLPPLQEHRRLDCIFSELNTHPTYSPPQKHKLSQHGHELEPEFRSLPLQRVDLLVAISLVVVLHPLVNVVVPVFQHAVDESGETVGHGGDGFGGA
jgi:hypothetical protein